MKKKSKQEMDKMLDALKEVERLPDASFFGDDNSGDKREARIWAGELEHFIKTGEVAVLSEELRNWVFGTGWSPLEDFV